MTIDSVPKSSQPGIPFDQAPELLAPAGDWECVQAAVENGADAVYLGLDSGFNARARATNFRLDNVASLMDYLHRRGVKGYVTLNTLAFTDELPRMESVGRQLAAANVDAVLVQDLGVARLLRQICPELTLHASTQMTLTSAECIAVAEELGIARVVLPRELSLSEIRDIRSRTSMPLEAFVHGALCVAYSGQCLTSESLGGRSANRGQCAQACRLAYDLVCDGKDVPLGAQKYLLSPQDLAAFELTTELMNVGICSFKIEGRLKTPEYVANTVQHYRAAIDAAMAGRRVEFTTQQVQDVEMSFSRGFSPGWLQGCDHKMLVPATSSAKRGVLLGEVLEVGRDQVTVRLQAAIAAGDGVVFEGDRERNAEQGGRVYEVLRDGLRQVGSVQGGTVDLTFDHTAVRLSELEPGLKVWKTDDPRLNKRLRASFETADVRRRVALDMHVTAIVGEPLQITAVAASGARASVTSDEPLQAARKHPLSLEVLQEQLSRLGATVFQANSVTANITGNPMVPLSVLGLLRRQLIAQLETAPVRLPRQIAADDVLPRLRASLKRDAALTSTMPTAEAGVQLSVLCRTLPQLQAVIEGAAVAEDAAAAALTTTVYADFADIREYREAVAMGRASDVQVFPATPRIQKPGEMGLFKAMLKHQPQGVLIRNLSGLAFFRDHGVPVVADFSLNVTNELTADFLMNRGVQRVTASYDLNRDQLMDLVNVVPAEWLEVVIHQHMPMFHMEHCVFCAVLSPGTNKTNCGRPCDRHKVELRDRLGLDHPLTADVGCRNTLFNATPQSAAEVVPALLSHGLRHFRVEFLYDDNSRMVQTLKLYRQLLRGRIKGTDVWKHLQASKDRRKN